MFKLKFREDDYFKPLSEQECFDCEILPKIEPICFKSVEESLIIFK